jgi:hypothetical protein
MSIFGAFTDTREKWENGGRGEVLKLFEKNVYGERPAELKTVKMEYIVKSELQDGDYIRRDMEMRYKDFSARFFLFMPASGVRSGTFINVMTLMIADKNKFFPRMDCGAFPLSHIIERGFSAAVLIADDVAMDVPEGKRTGIFRHFPCEGGTGWGTVSAWAWGMSCVLDYLMTLDNIDSDRIAAIGHSRCGKTALWAAATDIRFAMAVSNCSGNTGAALSRGNTGETVRQINEQFPHWFCGDYNKYNGNENMLPVDQHMLLGLIAPRKCYVASATLDAWADPEGELLSVKLASPYYELYGRPGLVLEGGLKTDHSYHEGQLAYHRRSGKHELTPSDWEKYMDFLGKT